MSTPQSHISSFAKPAFLKLYRKGSSIPAFLKESYFDLASLRTRNLISTCLIVLTLILPVTGYLSSVFFTQVGDNLARARAVSVFIEDQPLSRLEQLTSTLTRYEQIESVELVSVPVNPTLAGTDITALVEVIPTAGLSPGEFSVLIGQLNGLPGVELVSWNKDTISRNLEASSYAKVITLLSVVLAAALLTLIIRWLVRKNIQSSREIVDIKHHLGATPLQICRPMLLKGILLGILAGSAGYGLAVSCMTILANLVDITFFKHDLQPGLLQILLFFCAVVTGSYVITRMAFRKIFFYIYQ